MIDVEVRGRFGQYIKAVLCNIIEEEAVVSYPPSQLEERIRLTEVRLPPNGLGDVSAGQGAEVLFAVQDTQNSQTADNGCAPLSDPNVPSSPSCMASKADHLELPAWWPCRVQKVRDDVAVVKLDVKPMPNATPADQATCTQLSTITDIVNRNSLRQLVTDAPHITVDTILRHCIEIPKELSDFASDTSVHAEFVKHCGGPTSLFYDSEGGCLVVLSTDKNTINNVKLLQDTHLKMLRQKWAITRSMRQTMRTLEGSRGTDSVRSTLAHSRSSGDWDTDPSAVVEKFYVSQRMMGLAIGTHGANIRAAREIPGVISIRVRETNGPGWRGGAPGVEPVGDNGDAALIIVEAKTAEAAKQARAKLEFVELYLGVPQRYVARLIGRRTSNILSVVEKSGVVSIHMDDQIQGPSDDEEVLNIGSLNLNYSGPPASNDIRRIFLRAGVPQATSQPATDERYSGFILLGTRDSVEKARLLINFQLDYIYDLEKMEASNMEIMRSLGPDVGSSYPARGRMNGRWAERRPSTRGSSGHARGGAESALNSNPSAEREHGGAYPPYSAGRRPPRGARPYNGDLRGRRGRGSVRIPRDYQDWQDPTGSNGDVIDRRRGSGDSDAVGSNLSHEFESDDRETDLQSGRNEYSSRKRPDNTHTTTMSAPDVDDGYRGGDESGSGENGVHSNGISRVRGAAIPANSRVEYDRGGRGSRVQRGRRSERRRGTPQTSGTYA